MSRGPYSPRDLGPAGRRLWRQVVDHYELEPGARALLVEACRSADLCERLAADAERPHCPRSVLVELRQQRLALAKLIAGLGI